LLTKVKVIADVTVYHGRKTYPRDSVFDYEGDDVDIHISKGLLQRVIAAPDQTDEAKKAAREAAQKRKDKEKEAVEKGLCAAKEAAKLSDEALAELLK
jgi:2-phosphoglycerate kinase